LAFKVCEKAKARSLLDSLSRVKTLEFKNPEVESAFDIQIKEVMTNLKNLQNKLQTEPPSPVQKVISNNKRDLKILNDELTLLKSSKQESGQKQQTEEKTATPDFKYTEIQPLLDSNAIFLEYVLTEDDLYVWVIEKDKFEIHKLPLNATRLKELVVNYLTTLKKPNLSKEEFSNHLKLGKELFNILLAPVKNKLTTYKSLVIVPDGPLYYLPFETLIVSQTSKKTGTETVNRNIPYLIKKVSIDYFHSGAVMASLLKQKESSSTPTKEQHEILAFGDPVYTTKESKTEFEIDKQVFYETRGVKFERLLYASQEVIDIAKTLNVDPASDCINLRDKATEKKVHDVDIKAYKRLHFATHGILADEITWMNQPSLVLSQVGTDEDYDGFLEMNEIYDLNLNADLVVLSACKTGLGEEIKGEGLVGLTHAFIHAGARSLVVSLWDVNDQSTSLLMESFYKNLKTMNKAEALRQAKLDLMKGSLSLSGERGVGGITESKERKRDCSHPYYWAPFVLIGNYN
jgi:CHAT domain-containing protein